MNLKQTFVKYRLKDNIISNELLYSGIKKGKSFEVRKAVIMEITTKTIIIYKVIDKTKYSLINADIFFIDHDDLFRRVPKIDFGGDLFIEHANLSKINDHT